MRNVLIACLIFFLGFIPVYSGDIKPVILLKKTLNTGDELHVPIPGTIKRVVILIHNLSDEESVIFRSEHFMGKERPENEIGPKSYRTITLKPKLTDETVTRKLDRKKIVLMTDNSDAVYFIVEKGFVDIEIIEEKKKL